MLLAVDLLAVRTCVVPENPKYLCTRVHVCMCRTSTKIRPNNLHVGMLTLTFCIPIVNI